MMAGPGARGLPFADLQPGVTATFSVEVGQVQHEEFRRLFGDESPIHCDPAFAAGTRFGRPIGYGFFLTGLLSRLYGEHLPGGSSICLSQQVNFVRPFFVGDTITVVGTVAGRSESTRTVDIKVEMFREAAECVLRGLGKVQVIVEAPAQPPLFDSAGTPITKDDFTRALVDLGVRPGDELFVHSDIAVFGKLRLSDRNALLAALSDCLIGAVGETGSVLMPTFTYSFCNGEVFDPRESRSTVGVLTEHFRRRTDVARTNHPIFSVAIWGRAKDEYLAIGRDSFDDNSVFGILRRRRGKILFFGTKFMSTFLHHAEQMWGVPYRFIKTFKGQVRTAEGLRDEACTFFVRHLDRQVDFEPSRLEAKMLANGTMTSVSVGAGRMLLAGAQEMFDEARSLLDEDVYGLLAGPPR
jgi:aminoglycoside 3-N-acetyltransferase